jgi:hypothetical protein
LKGTAGFSRELQRVHYRSYIQSKTKHETRGWRETETWSSWCRCPLLIEASWHSCFPLREGLHSCSFPSFM